MSLQRLQQSPSGANALQAVQQDLLKAKVRISPRYGRFDTKSVDIVDTAPNWQVAPSPTASAQPSATP
ncbi:hypothetical protein GCM10025868_14370 [Angustibacter aerolatus]|uniref:Uncharacterized protein n=1 Tax=Angustibacter aerolatus TaxID=1162965 RepID=A0ABQ6JDB8_9ACTN|nr:hypothetical protein GCM10025868_14370 [Angustibacter aerolatus]